jgi:exopolysaccharide production protein ExoZ
MERFFRIVPMYWLLTSVILILFICVPALFNSRDLDISWAISSYVFVSQAYAGKMPVLYDGWTLEYEILFYIVFAMALNIKRLEWTVFASASAMLIFYLATGHMIVLEFVFGMVIGLVRKHCHTAPVTPWLTLIVGVLFIYLSGVNGLQFDDHRAWAIGIPAALIVYASTYVKQWPADLLTRLGDASYSIYLVQVFTISGWYKMANKMNLQHWDFILAVACVLGTVVFGTLTHACVEKPLTRLVLPFKAWLQRVLRAPAYQ